MIISQTTFEELRPLTRERAAAVLATGRNGYGCGCDGKKDYRQLLQGDELFSVSKFWQQDAPGSWSFNDVIRNCAR